MGRYITTTGTSGAVIVEASGALTARVNDRILADTSGAAFTITLPANASLVKGDTIQIVDVTGSFGTNNCTIARNGSKIQNLTEDLTLNINNAVVTIMYSGANYGWVLLSS
jgi:hypothetical protein